MAEHVINYWVEEDADYVCFRHAVQAVIDEKEVSPEISDYGEDRPCVVCKNKG